MVRAIFLPIIAKSPLFSRCYGWFQKTSRSAKKIPGFIKDYNIDVSEFADPLSSFRSFNDFFIRRLTLSSRPIDPHSNTAVIPADGRYFFYQDISQTKEFVVKGKKFKLEELVGSKECATRYAKGSMMIARLCPSDYHRFHFPCDGIPGAARVINGALYSVNPIALKYNIGIFSQNKRTITEIATDAFGQILYLEVGATNVGSIVETYDPGHHIKKGSEKGYFEFGGSALILLFPEKAIQFDEDLLKASSEGIEIRCLMGQRMGLC